MQSAFAMKAGVTGAADFLLGQATLAEVVHPSGFDNLDVIPAGRQVPNPAEQLAGPWLAQLSPGSPSTLRWDYT